MTGTGDCPELGHGLEVVTDLRMMLGEGPFWDEPRARLVFVDSQAGTIFQFDPPTGTLSRVEAGAVIGIAIPRQGGGYAASSVDGLLSVSPEGKVELLAPIEADRPDNRMNDAKCDVRGRMFSGTMSVHIERGAGNLYRIDPDHSVHRLVEGISVSNGLGWSPDNRSFYYIDTSARGVDRFDYDLDSGAIANRTRLVDIPRDAGFPDGMTIDEEGCLWVALYKGGAVRRFSPSGELIGQVSLPVSGVTSCCFGGPDMADLYITTARFGIADDVLSGEPLAGALFRCRTDVRGLPSTPYAG